MKGGGGAGICSLGNHWRKLGNCQWYSKLLFSVNSPRHSCRSRPVRPQQPVPHPILIPLWPWPVVEVVAAAAAQLGRWRSSTHSAGGAPSTATQPPQPHWHHARSTSRHRRRLQLACRQSVGGGVWWRRRRLHATWPECPAAQSSALARNATGRETWLNRCPRLSCDVTLLRRRLVRQ